VTDLQLQLLIAAFTLPILLTVLVCWSIAVAARNVVNAVGYACRHTESGLMDIKRDVRNLRGVVAIDRDPAINHKEKAIDKAKPVDGIATNGSGTA